MVGHDVSYPWGMSYDGKNFYLGDNTFGINGSVLALDPATGENVWRSPATPCTPGPGKSRFNCWSGYMATAISTPGLVWLGSMDGVLWARDSANGHVLWKYDTAQNDVATVNGVPGHGGSIGPANATVANGQVYVTSGYAAWNETMMEGNVLFVFGLPERQKF
jgi:polyvinyl alcohol dehydrogenase (cytochrome)